MPTDPFERNDRQDKIARGLAQGTNLILSVVSIIGGIVLIYLGAHGIGGAIPVIFGVLVIGFGIYNLRKPTKL